MGFSKVRAADCGRAGSRQRAALAQADRQPRRATRKAPMRHKRQVPGGPSRLPSPRRPLLRRSCQLPCHRSARRRLLYGVEAARRSILLHCRSDRPWGLALPGIGPRIMNAWAWPSSASARLRPADPSCVPSRARARLTFQRSPREAPTSPLGFVSGTRPTSNHNHACYRSVTVTTDEAERRVSTSPSVHVP